LEHNVTFATFGEVPIVSLLPQDADCFEEGASSDDQEWFTLDLHELHAIAGDDDDGSVNSLLLDLRNALISQWPSLDQHFGL